MFGIVAVRIFEKVRTTTTTRLVARAVTVLPCKERTCSPIQFSWRLNFNTAGIVVIKKLHSPINQWSIYCLVSHPPCLVFCPERSCEEIGAIVRAGGWQLPLCWSTSSNHSIFQDSPSCRPCVDTCVAAQTNKDTFFKECFASNCRIAFVSRAQSAALMLFALRLPKHAAAPPAQRPILLETNHNKRSIDNSSTMASLNDIVPSGVVTGDDLLVRNNSTCFLRGSFR